MTSSAESTIRALTFDVFGTVVDWRSSIIREGESLNRDKGLTTDWAAFADAWRALYQPAMAQVRDGVRPWTTLDVLHRENLEQLLDRFGLADLSESERDHLNRVWHRLDPWPDSVTGLARLRRHFIVAALSNGNIALLVNMAKHAGLPWDAVLGAEAVRCYKPLPEAYTRTAALLALAPGQCLMVAAHNGDLHAAAGCGFRTAFIRRPTEHGPAQRTDLEPDVAFDFVAEDLNDLAGQLGC